MGASRTDYRVQRVDPLKWKDVLLSLQAQCFLAEEMQPVERGHWFIAFHTPTGDPAGFGGIRDVRGHPRLGYMHLAGVLRAHRGHGLQRRLIDARVRLAKKLGWTSVITTTYQNPPSANNLIAAGFRQYWPQHRWMAEGTDYWMKRLD